VEYGIGERRCLFAPQRVLGVFRQRYELGPNSACVEVILEHIPEIIDKQRSLQASGLHPRNIAKTLFDCRKRCPTHTGGPTECLAEGEECRMVIATWLVGIGSTKSTVTAPHSSIQSVQQPPAKSEEVISAGVTIKPAAK
jgi:hypothetical protein